MSFVFLLQQFSFKKKCTRSDMHVHNVLYLHSLYKWAYNGFRNIKIVLSVWERKHAWFLCLFTKTVTSDTFNLSWKIWLLLWFASGSKNGVIRRKKNIMGNRKKTKRLTMVHKPQHGKQKIGTLDTHRSNRWYPLNTLYHCRYNWGPGGSMS